MNITKELDFIGLTKEVQMDIVKTLACYDDCHLERHNGKWGVFTGWMLCDKYDRDFAVGSTYKKADMYDRNWYFDLWYKYINERKANGQIVDGEWFEENIAKPYYDEAYTKYFNHCKDAILNEFKA